MTIRFATDQDAAALADLARRTFHDTFAATNNPGDMALYLAQAYGVEQQAREIADPRVTTLLVDEGSSLIAYAQLRNDHVPACVTDAGAIELWRFYVAAQWHGQGVAQRLMASVRDEAKRRGAQTMWLGVWERNERARAFYQKCGFTVAGDHIFLFGTDPQTDLVLVTSL